jgi:hypothetical protein
MSYLLVDASMPSFSQSEIYACGDTAASNRIDDSSSNNVMHVSAEMTLVKHLYTLLIRDVRGLPGTGI